MSFGRVIGNEVTKSQIQYFEDFFSLQEYLKKYFKNFNPTAEFVKWAWVEVDAIDSIPNNMERFTLAEGVHAVFDYKGSGSAHDIFQYIYGEWISNSKYQLDDRPHFEVLGAMYKNNDLTSEEEIWIPIKNK
ncbi:GyrI-like domain-containing protein [Maribacter sp. ACAM166]|uniref:GyrI-like domain-containing protein n=1 Tax=Maribacter sp. ACAM166 TaxID=2508996 RepID=UPI002016FE6C|nr:effector binding domain-containing protein [Maribacter sp. ACAM166]